MERKENEIKLAKKKEGADNITNKTNGENRTPRQTPCNNKNREMKENESLKKKKNVLKDA